MAQVISARYRVGYVCRSRQEKKIRFPESICRVKSNTGSKETTQASKQLLEVSEKKHTFQQFCFLSVVVSRHTIIAVQGNYLN